MNEQHTGIDPASEWRDSQLLYRLYNALGREFTIEIPPCTEFELAEETPSAESLEIARVWLRDVDRLIPVHQLRHFLQTSTMADEECLRACLDHHLRAKEHSEADRDKVDFLLVQYFSIRAQSPLSDFDAGSEYVARILEPAVGLVRVSQPEDEDPLEQLVQSATSCRSLRELFASGIIENGRKQKASLGEEYYAPAKLIGFTRFNFLMRRVFFRLMHQDLNQILEGLHQLEERGMTTLDCRAADFSAEEPVSRLRMICQSWKVMFQAEYSSGQPLRLLADLRGLVDSAVSNGFGVKVTQPAASPAVEPSTASEAAAVLVEEAPLRAKAASASAGSSAGGSDGGDPLEETKA